VDFAPNEDHDLIADGRRVGIAASGAAMNGCSAVHLTIFGLNPVVVFGNDRLKDTFLSRAAAPYVMVTAGESEVVLLLVRTGEADSGFDGLSLFLADLDPDHVDIRPIPKVARNAVASCEVFYDDLPVEGWRLVGEEGQGFRHILHGLNPERILLAAGPSA